MDKRAQLILGFPGVGKSYATKVLNEDGYIVFDSDSSAFSHTDNGEKNPQFPDNYINHIIELMQDSKVDFIFISTHKEVRDKLIELNLPFTIVYPSKRLLYEYIGRYYMRGSNDQFIKLLYNNFINWIDEIDEINYNNCVKIMIDKPNMYLLDYIPY